MITIAAFIIMMSLQAHKEEPKGAEPTIGAKAILSIEFDNIVGEQNLQLNTGAYTNGSGENYSVSLLQYFISNISVKKADGTVYTVPQDSSYFLIKESDPAARYAKVQVPEGEYSSITFVLGVDSLRSTMDISKRTGVLEPSGGMEDGMYWGWNSGYIFFKFEGTSPHAPVDPTGQHKFRYHIGGFGGYAAPTINNIRTITIDLTAAGNAKVRSGRVSNVHLLVDLAKLFNGSTTVRIAANPTVMFSAYSANIADNFNNMFRHDHTEN
ncbi:MbnP family protein [Longitalea luteola]|uniref:MbnP family protein n=1 Tax=Longitalea luteola TaxID=2812563 RepID=UPI001A959FBF|nr:MbnP family protein [Longitalea luteola]